MSVNALIDLFDISYQVCLCTSKWDECECRYWRVEATLLEIISDNDNNNTLFNCNKHFNESYKESLSYNEMYK